MKRPSWSDLNALGEIIARRSFREAADALGVTRSSLSHTVRAMERDLGVRLLHRTTRSVSPTPEGERLITRALPLMSALDEVLSDLAPSAEQLRGVLRINGNEGGIRYLLSTVVPRFVERYPQVELDLVTDGALVDIIERGFDAGVRLTEAVPRDMVAVPLGPALRFLAVASPRYLAGHPEITEPQALHRHRCIRQRLPSGKRYRWEFARDGKAVSVDVPGQLTLDNSTLMVEAAIDGLGIAYVPEPYAQAAIAEGRLVAVLLDWCPVEPGLALYYSGHRQVPAALRAFIDMLKAV
ncbi:LysR family transcriptional regulator [Stutzerimonas nosocomialis]|uniref:LysR family transcriptional regulator n=1 Tax=Stutzerimonas nosocomialis TaxID=1056496 RepID=UPI001109CECA|nr:LysR family transcriptional regulator [Stutzerimonas nosocomialis]TLX55797.1 LysR family transcriptional regulator [Stutzerimonas nosocomialis]